MTRMLPPTIHSGVRSGAERKLFEVIRDAPGTDDWVCVHSLGLARHGYKRRAEIDFALVMPEAVLILEVKGGRVERRDGRWIHTDRFGVPHTKAESPFDQASSAMFALERELRDHFGPRCRLSTALLTFGVMFPDVEFQSLGVEAQRAQVYDKRDAAKPFTRWVQDLIKHARNNQHVPRNGLDKKEIATLVDYLRGDFELIPSFDVTAEDVNRELNRLTRQQAAALSGMERGRLLVEGSAGTGKSMVAIETARREAAAGHSVLFLCFNKLLAAKLRRALKQAAPTVRIQYAHDYMRDVISQSAVASDFELARSAETNTRRLYDVVYPEYAAIALAGGSLEPFDFLIVDEAQDLLSAPFVELLDQSLRDGIDDGRWRIFLDTNEQAAVYGKLDERVLDRLRKVASTTVLPVNCRNTTQIGLATRAIARPRTTALAFQTGEHVERRWYRDARGLANELRAILRELVDRGVPPACTSILYASAPDGIDQVFNAAGVRPLTAEYVPLLGTRDGKFATHSTTSGFKGLENDVVILLGVENVEDDWWRAATYVGMSRARVKLFILIHADLRTSIDRRFEAIVREAMMEATP